MVKKILYSVLIYFCSFFPSFSLSSFSFSNEEIERRFKEMGQLIQFQQEEINKLRKEVGELPRLKERIKKQEKQILLQEDQLNRQEKMSNYSIDTIREELGELQIDRLQNIVSDIVVLHDSLYMSYWGNKSLKDKLVSPQFSIGFSMGITLVSLGAGIGGLCHHHFNIPHSHPGVIDSSVIMGTSALAGSSAGATIAFLIRNKKKAYEKLSTLLEKYSQLFKEVTSNSSKDSYIPTINRNQFVCSSRDIKKCKVCLKMKKKLDEIQEDTYLAETVSNKKSHFYHSSPSNHTKINIYDSSSITITDHNKLVVHVVSKKSVSISQAEH